MRLLALGGLIGRHAEASASARHSRVRLTIASLTIGSIFYALGLFAGFGAELIGDSRVLPSYGFVSFMAPGCLLVLFTVLPGDQKIILILRFLMPIYCVAVVIVCALLAWRTLDGCSFAGAAVMLCRRQGKMSQPLVCYIWYLLVYVIGCAGCAPPLRRSSRLSGPAYEGDSSVGSDGGAGATSGAAASGAGVGTGSFLSASGADFQMGPRAALLNIWLVMRFVLGVRWPLCPEHEGPLRAASPHSVPPSSDLPPIPHLVCALRPPPPIHTASLSPFPPCAQASPLMSVVATVVLLVHSDPAVSYGSLRLPVTNMIASLVWFSCALVANTRNRQRAHAWLKRVTMSDEARAAAVIAAMVGGHKTHDRALEVAKEAFRAVPFDRLVASDFGQCDMGALSGKAVSLPLGGCDAFLSHSWRDHAVLKWEALSKWAAAFHEAEARTPTIWLDKV